MIDDPHDSTWIPPTKKVAWCPVHNEDMETCACGRDPDINVLATLFILVIIFMLLISCGVALVMVLT